MTNRFQLAAKSPVGSVDPTAEQDHPANERGKKPGSSHGQEPAKAGNTNIPSRFQSLISVKDWVFHQPIDKIGLRMGHEIGKRHSGENHRPTQHEQRRSPDESETARPSPVIMPAGKR